MGIGELKRMITSGLRFSSIAAVLLLVIVVMSTKFERGECISVKTSSTYGRCNGTVGECGQVDEFLMESEVITRLLAGKPPVLGYRALGYTGPVCDETLYGNCLKPINPDNTRPCTVRNRCSKKGQ